MEKKLYLEMDEIARVHLFDQKLADRTYAILTNCSASFVHGENEHISVGKEGPVRSEQGDTQWEVAVFVTRYFTPDTLVRLLTPENE